MKTVFHWLVGVVVGIAIGAAGYAAYISATQHARQVKATNVPGSRPAATAPQKAGDIDPATGRKVLYWHDPMAPGQKFDRPGKSPFMDMQLVPVYAESGGDESGVSVSARVQQNLGVRTVEVRRGSQAMPLEAVGSVAYNERDVAVVQARSNGYIERLFVRAPLDPVCRGQPLAELYVPDWVAAQEEYLTVKRIAAQSTGTSVAGLVEGARQRMHLAGMTDEHIRAIEAGGKVQPRITITAPIGGVVGEIGAREGMTVMAGAPLFRLNGLSTGLGERRGARKRRSTPAPRQRRSGACGGCPRYDLQRKNRGHPPRGEPCYAHHQGAHRARHGILCRLSEPPRPTGDHDRVDARNAV